MYICLDCDKVFEEPKVHYDHHPYGMTYATEEWWSCPYCGESNIDIMVECSRCGEPLAKDSANVGEDLMPLCDCCWGDMYGE